MEGQPQLSVRSSPKRAIKSKSDETRSPKWHRETGRRVDALDVGSRGDPIFVGDTVDRLLVEEDKKWGWVTF